MKDAHNLNENFPQRENKVHAWKMFDRISGRYDALNRILSARQDISWRKKVADFLPEKQGIKLLDLATGTADQIIYLFSKTSKIKHATGMDLSEGMLRVGRKKLEKLGLDSKVSLITGDAMNIPSDENSFDVATISFGIRNVPDTSLSLREMLRVLKPGGKTIILEFSLPENAFIRSAYLSYFRHVLPRVGSVISGDSHAYKYLNRTVEDFPYGEDFEYLMREIGFINTSHHELSLGIATIYTAEKPPEMPQ